MNNRLTLLLSVLTLIGLFYLLDLASLFSLESLKAHHADLDRSYRENPFQFMGWYALTYIVMAALSLPGAAVMSLAGGALFGFWLGVPLVLLSATIGATLAFWAARYLFRDAVSRRFRDRLAAIDQGLARDGAFYLFSLRMVPAIPFFLINLLMGLTRLPTGTFFWVSLIGMLAGSIVYVNAGTQLAAIEAVSDILSPSLLASFLLLAGFPWLARWGIDRVQIRRRYVRWPKPQYFDRNLIVIGAGAAGLVTAYVAAAVRAKVTLIEAHKMGGDCLNYGCVPSKALIRTAAFLRQARTAQSLGIAHIRTDYDFGEVMQRVRRVIQTIEPHDSVARYTQLGVEVIEGRARITSPWTVEVDGQILTTRAIVIASGARPYIPPLPGLESVRYFTSETIWSLTERPGRLVVLGGGPIGCELAQAFARLDCEVILVEQGRLMPHEDVEVAEHMAAFLREDNIHLLTHTEAVRCERAANGAQCLIVRGQDGSEQRLPFDALLCAVGRVARTEGLGLETLAIPLTERHTIETNGWLQTIYPNIYACGDVAGPYQFTHAAAHQAWYAAVNALFGDIKRFKVDYTIMPWTTFTDPEVARVGLSEAEAKTCNIGYEVTRYDLNELDRAIADEAAHGFVKVLTVPGKDRILGATIVSAHASDLLAEFVLAMRHGLGLNKILGTIHSYPTWSEANKYVAGEWKRKHVSQRLLGWLEKYHGYRRASRKSERA